MGDQDSFRLMPVDVASTVLLVLAFIGFVFFTHGVHAQGLRLEADFGKCRHQLAPDASWHYSYGGYQNEMGLSPSCAQIGALWKVDSTFGWRMAYVDLGVITAANTYPVDEQAYFIAKDTHTAVVSPTAYFTGTGNSRGFTFGPVFEKSVKGFTFGAEAGVAVLYNTWHVNASGVQGWNYADGWNSTYYLGINARYRSILTGVRLYRNVHASQADENPMYIGPTSGPVVQATIGVSVGL